MTNEALTAPAVARNRQPIGDVLRELLPRTAHVLEIGSGTGEHAMWFCRLFPEVVWQPTDQDPASLASIAAWRQKADHANFLAPLPLDASKPDDWPVKKADAVVSINMIHISPWEATEGMMTGAAAILPAGGFVFLYGPFRETGTVFAEGNAAFDADLRQRNAQWGIRNLDDVVETAARQDIILERIVRMPANNLSIVLRKR